MNKEEFELKIAAIRNCNPEHFLWALEATVLGLTLLWKIYCEVSDFKYQSTGRD